MVEKSIKEIKESLNQHFKEDVNSFDLISNSLCDLNKKLSEHIESFGEHKLAQEKATAGMKAEYMELKLILATNAEEIKPVIELFGNLKWGDKVLMKIGGIIASIIGLLLGLFELIKIISNFRK